MKAFVVTEYKGPLQASDVPEPAVGEHDVLVQVQAAGLNVLGGQVVNPAVAGALDRPVADWRALIA